MSDSIVQRALHVRAEDGHYEIKNLDALRVLGPVDYGLLMNKEKPCLCIGSGILAGGIIPGSNRLIFCGHSPVWDGFYVSTMGGAALLWDGVGISFLSISGKAPKPSVMVLSGVQAGDPKVRLVPIDLFEIWNDLNGPGGVYSLQKYVLNETWDGQGSPRVLATGPAAQYTQMGAICSSRITKGKPTPIDCWAGRGGFGSSMLQEHNIAAIVYGGDFEDEDLTDRAEADGYFKKMFSKRMLLKDLEATTKYRYDPKWKSGGTFGVNYSKLADWMLSFNYRSVNFSLSARKQLWERLVRDHYLKQFNDETIKPKRFAHCGEPCPAVCKKYYQEYKKDYEPYQAMGPLSGIFDQRAAELVNHHADALGFDAIQIGGQLAWLMECLYEEIISPRDLGLDQDCPAKPVFEPAQFEPVGDSQKNARLAVALLDLSATENHLLARGMRVVAHKFGSRAKDCAVYLANGDKGWMVPNQYWVPGMFSPMAVMGKYYVYYGSDFRPPRELGRKCAERMIAEITTDNAGVCRFHRGWSEKLFPEIVSSHFKIEIDYPGHHASLAKSIYNQGRPVFWESARIEELIQSYLRRVAELEPDVTVLADWVKRFEKDRSGAARAYWDEIKAGIDERMVEIAE
ncbi:MAG: aldehyde ferredoxin oxidoreductase [Deltaproteobacteria bacterium]|nr:aldehyde ferredoxin oxidoreductase [Deltaproteobacteria bacterium]